MYGTHRPRSLPAADLEYLSALSRLVAVVPVIAKADCHTREELAGYRRRVERAMAARCDAQGRPDPVRPFRFSAAALDAVQLGFDGDGDSDSDPAAADAVGGAVFSVLTSRTLEELEVEAAAPGGSSADGGGDGGPASVLVPVRTYGWGRVSGGDPAASSTMALQRLLTEDVWALMEDARDRYLAFCSAYEATGRRIEPLLEQLLAPYDAALEDGAAAATRLKGVGTEAEAEAAVMGATATAVRRGRRRLLLGALFWLGFLYGLVSTALLTALRPLGFLVMVLAVLLLLLAVMVMGARAMAVSPVLRS
ncbi:hypothetical protein GPECTOR_12g421 [Gonium pectorale]|uniref:Septin-type G domain-containing protein n=1 Tax=Gonium pectorale TaxID=33097 RepID=A0A150GNY5_GONPE|nr:hypothetical protein GPECTOR_12g421 [Gonium pectorale]|eukprot:KXZ51458.1 hypothetical protein GPECTOR_12g421 [Gonium pectorale]